jgi:hypothetical protein
VAPVASGALEDDACAYASDAAGMAKTSASARDNGVLVGMNIPEWSMAGSFGIETKR